MSLNDLNKFKKDLKNSKTHKYMHLPEDGKKEIFTIHRRSKGKTIWYKGGDWVEMESKNSPTNPEIVSYRCPTFPYHSLHKAVLSTQTPKIRVMDGFKISFCKDLLINMIKSFRISHNEIELEYGNTVSLYEEVLKNCTDESYIEFGNKENLTEPSEVLESTPISLTVPFFYSQSLSDSFPLIYCGQKDDLIHQFEFNLDFSSLLLMYNKEGERVLFNKDLIQIENNMERMPIPDLEGLVSYMEENDSKIVNNFNSDGDTSKELYTKSIYYYEDENPKNLGNKVHLKFGGDDKQPVHSIFWGAQNFTRSESDKNLVFDFGKNISPVKYTEKLSSSSGVLVNNKSSYKTEFGYFEGKGITGINKWYNSVNDKEDGKKFVPGVRCNGGSLTLKLAERNSEDQFTVFSVLKYCKRFLFISYPKNFQERKDLRSSIVPDEDE